MYNNKYIVQKFWIWLWLEKLLVLINHAYCLFIHNKWRIIKWFTCTRLQHEVINCGAVRSWSLQLRCCAQLITETAVLCPVDRCSCGAARSWSLQLRCCAQLIAAACATDAYDAFIMLMIKEVQYIGKIILPFITKKNPADTFRNKEIRRIETFLRKYLNAFEIFLQKLKFVVIVHFAAN